MQVKLWGVRGSVPSPLDPRDYRSRLSTALESAREIWRRSPDISLEDTLTALPAYVRELIGGETTCVELRDGAEQLIFDMGTGARRLGYDMMARAMGGPIHILMTHTHWDHIQGWPFFVPAYLPSNEIHFHSCFKNCEERFILQQGFDFFPLTFHEMMSKREFHYFEQGDTFEIGSFNIRTEGLVHPGQSTAYRVEKDGRSFIFATDTEFSGPDLEKTVLKKKKKFFEGADVLILDSQYSLKEAEQKVGWGHTAMLVAVDCAVAWKVKRLVMTHHEPAHDDRTTWGMFDDACEHLAKTHPGALELVLALEGQTIDV